MRTDGGFLIVACLLVLGITGTGAQATPTTASSALDADCSRFNDPSAVVDGEIVYTSFTAYDWALDHAVKAWSPDRGFAIPLRNSPPIDGAVPPDATLIYRDADVPGSAFKGVTVTWSNAPATVTLNLAQLPAPDTNDPQEREEILAVMTHETGHALGLGDVPPPGVTIRECANMLMKRSVDKGGGAFTLPQPGDVALYCLRWGGQVCGQNGLARPAALPPPLPRAPVATGAVAESAGAGVTYRVRVVTCSGLPAGAITAAQVEHGDGSLGCVRAPAGMLFYLNRDDNVQLTEFTNSRGELSVVLPEGVAGEITTPQGVGGGFPSLVGYEPVEQILLLSADEPACNSGPASVCQDVYVLVPTA
jgi:hypothetical protein